MNSPIFIAEPKVKSPYGYESKTPKHKLIDLAIEHGDWISVHTNALFGGCFDDIYLIKKLTNKKILAKGFHCHDDDVKKAVDLGADYVLVVDRYVGHYWGTNQWGRVIAENPTNTLSANVGRYVYNSRNLRTGEFRPDEYASYRRNLPWLCYASNITRDSDIPADCDAYLVGRGLEALIANRKLDKVQKAA